MHIYRYGPQLHWSSRINSSNGKAKYVIPIFFQYSNGQSTFRHYGGYFMFRVISLDINNIELFLGMVKCFRAIHEKPCVFSVPINT